MGVELPGRRVRALLIIPSLLLWLVRYPDDRAHVTSAGLPDDVRFVSAHYDANRSAFVILVESETFERVPEGHLPLALDLEFTRHAARDAGA